MSWANPLDQFGFGARARAMGGAGTAISEDFTAAWYNPAGIVSAEGTATGIGFFLAQPRLEIDGRDTDVDATGGIEAGFIAPSTMLGTRVAIGAGLHIPTKRVARFLVLSGETVRFTMYSNLTQRISVSLPVAVRVTDWLDIGAGVNLLGDNSGGVDFIIRQEGRGDTEGSLSAAQIARFSPMAGVVVRPRDDLRLAAAFRGQMKVQLDTPVTLRFDELVIPPSDVAVIGPSLLDISATTITHFQPQQVSAAFAWQASPDLLLTAEVTWRDWSEFVPPIPKTVTVLEGGLADLLPDLPEFPVPDANFDDTFEPAVGVEWRALSAELADLWLRAGYFYRPTPAPTQRGEINLVDNDLHGIGFGLGIDLHILSDMVKGPVHIDLNFLGHFLESQTVRKTDPANLVGSFRAGGSILGGGIMVTVTF